MKPTETEYRTFPPIQQQALYNLARLALIILEHAENGSVEDVANAGIKLAVVAQNLLEEIDSTQALAAETHRQFTPEQQQAMYDALQRIAQNTNSSVDWNESRQAIAQRTLQALAAEPAASEPALETGKRYVVQPSHYKIVDTVTNNEVGLPLPLDAQQENVDRLNADSGNGGQG